MRVKPNGTKASGVRRPATTERSDRASGAIGQRCPIVGIGASAGGLEAVMQLLKHLPLDTGFGFVLVQHLDPRHESALTQLLKPATSMPVCEVTNNLRVEPNHVYVIPPNTTLGIARGALKLQPRSKERVALRTIDFFFEALARDQRERAIGVILSGTASDGTQGLEAIKAEGGLTFAQDASAKYDSMPRSAVAAGCVDLVLSPQNIAKELTRVARHPYVAGRAPSPILHSNGKTVSGGNGAPTLPRVRGGIESKSNGRGRVSDLSGAGAERAGRAEEDGYKKILLLLRNHCGVDFSLYKSTTIHRRITRRTVLNRQDTLENYSDFLRGNVKELDALYSDALIGVTSFFRNAEAFAVLKQKVFARLLQQRDDQPLRVWVLGCSTGQEAYSIAMAFAESADRIPRARKLQVFATDLNEANLERARQGLYAKSLVQDLSPERLRRFFLEEKGGYRVVKPLRELVVFARQNLISDPPFSRMDLISCRNLMIYLEPGLQKKALPAFHYALKPEGYLFLGASESIGTFTDLFDPVDKKQKIFSKKSAPTLGFQLPVRNERGERLPGRAPRASIATGKRQRSAAETFGVELNAEREADRVTINQFAPPGVLISADLQILQFRGPTDAYLKPPTGKARFDLLKMAREGLMLPLRAAINRAKKENDNARTENVLVRQNGKTRAVDVEVVPLKNLKERCFLVLFEDSGKPKGVPRSEQRDGAPTSAHPASKKEESRRIAGLERDLVETRDYLQSIQEHQDAATEELQASNEEGQSANEELQSLNEELETSKEELESTNEELTTVNDEMVCRNAELNQLNSDLTNLQTSTKLVIVLLGRDLTIRRFSTQAEKQFGLQASDVGHPIGGIRHNLDLPDLAAVIRGVIKNVCESEREVRDRNGRWYSLRVRPYLTVDNAVDGAVLVLVDIDDLKRTEGLIVEEHEHAEAIIRTVPNPLVILTSDLRIQSANAAFYRTFKLSRTETEGRLIYEFDHATWDIPRLRHLLEEIIPRNSVFDDFEVTHEFERIGFRSLLLNARLLNEPGGRSQQILLGIRDVTERHHAENALRAVRAQLAGHAVRLEELVTKRTAQLTLTNKRLEASVHAAAKGREEYRVLFLESQVMQKKLRHVARLIISAQEEERKEISRELHDEVVQTLVGINVELSALGTAVSMGAHTLERRIARTQRLVEQSVHSVHRFARGLRPAVLDDLGLIPALHAYSKGLAARKKMRIQLTADKRVEALGSAKRTVLYRVAQEALTNVARHARATTASLSIRKIPGAIRMEISDNGRSFHVRKALMSDTNKRLGLVGMKERIEMIGGRLAIESTPGVGTTVRAEIPFNPRKTKE